MGGFFGSRFPLLRLVTDSASPLVQQRVVFRLLLLLVLELVMRGVRCLSVFVSVLHYLRIFDAILES